ncbi:MAG TPA: succinylglutamate desuccinylase/aspartoacylase family protein [Casimicrobiaceae bacterium]|nr:succinylglutamate desuccinylase/aspartoacylase family protein [Casimicrobiaceae bacterium]
MPSAPLIDIDFPDIGRWASGNTGVPYVWRFEAARPGPSVTVQALTHGNEVCGAIAVDWLLARDVRPVRGTLTLVFANVRAYQSFDPADPFASRCVDEDFNRLWTADVLDGGRRSAELNRARALRPFYDATEFLLDLHSMTDPCAPLALAGRQHKGLVLARGVGLPEYIVVDEGHQAGRRLRDYAFFDDPADPRAALLIECGQHWERKAAAVAHAATLRFLRHFGMLDAVLADTAPPDGTLPAQQAIEVTDVLTIGSDAFEFALPVHGLMRVPRAGTLLARDGSQEIRTPYDDCVLIMPTRRPKRGETAVRLGRFV